MTWAFVIALILLVLVALSNFALQKRVRQLEQEVTDLRSGQDISQRVSYLVHNGREVEAIEQLTGCVAQLHEVQAAKAQLASLTPAEVRAALEFRRGGIGEAQ